MIAVDTNVVIRFLTHDDPRQVERAVAVFEQEEVWLSKTVLLETYWVLESLYKLTREQIDQALQRLFGMPNVQVEDATSVAQAMEWQRLGLDFADALHLAGRGSATRFVSFDARFVRRASRAGRQEVFLA